jgi:hypothetical protein
LVGSVTTIATGTYTIGPEVTAGVDEDAVAISRRTAARAIHDAGVSVGVPGEVPANGLRTSLTSSEAIFVIEINAVGRVVCRGIAVGSVMMLCTLGVDGTETRVFDCGTTSLRLDKSCGVLAAD